MIESHMKRKTPAIKAMPAERPSILSSRLKALLMPTIQKILIKILAVWESNQLTFIPRNTREETMTTWPISLYCGLISNTSSISPSAKIPILPATTIHIGFPTVEKSEKKSRAVSQAASVAKRILTPPNRALGVLCHRSFFGLATMLFFWASSFRAGVRQVVSKQARKKVIAKIKNPLISYSSRLRFERFRRFYGGAQNPQGVLASKYPGSASACLHSRARRPFHRKYIQFQRSSRPFP